MAKRNFDKDRKAQKLHEATLGGHTLHLKPTFPADTYLDGNTYKGFQGVVDFLRKMIVPADREVFESILTGDEVTVSEVDIIEVSNWYIEVVTGRPTNGSRTSQPGPETTSATSEDASPSLEEATKT